MSGTVKASVIQHDVSGAATVFRDGAANEIGQLCKSWCRWDASSSTVAGSFNTSSITFISAGYYQVNMTNAMTDANYSMLFISSDAPTVGTLNVIDNATAPTSTTFRTYGTGSSRKYNCSSVFR